MCVWVGKNGELLPTTEEAEELVRALQAMGSYPDSLVCLTSIGDLAPSEAVDHRAMTVFPGPVQTGGMGDLLSSRIPTENFTSLELEDNLLQSTDGHFPPSPPSQSASQPSTSSSSTAAPPTTTLLTQNSVTERTFSRTHTSHVLGKSDAHTSSPQGSHYSSEHVPSPYSDNISSPHAGTFQTDTPLLLEVSLSGVPEPQRSSWNSLPLPLTDPTQFGNLIGSESHLISTSLSTPPATTHSVTLQPMAALSAMPQSGLTGLTTPPAPSSSSHDLLTSTQPKQQLPQFSAAFGHQLASHSGIPKDVQPSHSSIAPPAGFSAVSTAAASANNATPPFTQSKWEQAACSECVTICGLAIPYNPVTRLLIDHTLLHLSYVCNVVTMHSIIMMNLHNLKLSFNIVFPSQPGYDRDCKCCASPLFDALWFRQQGVTVTKQTGENWRKDLSRDYVSQCSKFTDIDASVSGRFICFVSQMITCTLPCSDGHCII